MFRLPSPSIAISMLALLVALGGAGYSATGGNFILGQTNTATTQTKLLTAINGASFRVDNTSTAAAATAMTLVVKPGRPPFAINSAVKVTNLNADKLDGLDSAAFASSTSEGWHYIGDEDEPDFENGWVNVDETVLHDDLVSFAHAAYRIDANGVVHLRGFIKTGLLDEEIFTLPAPYCPHFFKSLPVVSNGAFGEVFVNPDCRVFAAVGSNVRFSLDGVSFQRNGLDELDAALP